MANYRERLLTDSPTGPSFSTARRERSEDLSHIRETLNPGVPGHPPHSIFGCLRAMACLPRGRLAYRGSLPIGWMPQKTLDIHPISKYRSRACGVKKKIHHGISGGNGTAPASRRCPVPPRRAPTAPPRCNTAPRPCRPHRAVPPRRARAAIARLKGLIP